MVMIYYGELWKKFLHRMYTAPHVHHMYNMKITGNNHLLSPDVTLKGGLSFVWISAVSDGIWYCLWGFWVVIGHEQPS